ncbi:SH3 domain-containing protein [Sphingomonas sp. KR1UV-12]|uniref:SH3 domain-containing protein n=1 Tax=Sphingomonas aurea TaxID=3063994 RepID=A0ABT9EGZ0_9SPHN|nr:SH3 domain-containing protein [Sphingomonas sp. KR1UV-12]MDP1026229.1 SH3 domain-containing protein [Sphingomonas sp. KR1UV-12]
MKSSGISSATAPSPQGAHPPTPSRKSFALAGRSVTLDPQTHAVRPDLADVRLADRVFAPHYAAHVPHRLKSDAILRAAREPDSDELTQLGSGDLFELLDLLGDTAWGLAPAAGLVGYLPAAALEPVES